MMEPKALSSSEYVIHGTMKNEEVKRVRRVLNAMVIERGKHDLQNLPASGSNISDCRPDFRLLLAFHRTTVALRTNHHNGHSSSSLHLRSLHPVPPPAIPHPRHRLRFAPRRQCQRHLRASGRPPPMEDNTRSDEDAHSPTSTPTKSTALERQ